MRRPSELDDTLRYLDGPFPKDDQQGTAPLDGSPAANDEINAQTSDREELMERIKRGESPTWIPNRGLEQYFQFHHDPPRNRTPRPGKNKGSPLLPAIELKDRPDSATTSMEESQGLAAEIERPRSALHAGDFTESSHMKPKTSDRTVETFDQSTKENFPAPSTAPWSTPFQSPLKISTDEFRFPSNPARTLNLGSRSRATSLSSFSSNFLLKSPTSPLVQQSNSGDPDFPSNPEVEEIPSSPSRNNRRYTLPPQYYQHLNSSSSGHYAAQSHLEDHMPSLSQRTTSAYQGRSPRRSVTSSFGLPTISNVYSPNVPRSRRPSLSSDVSPLHHAPMVGSYEESILRGRMSTTPSRPLDFVAQIGVLGKGNCKSSLRCPAHVTVPFPAVFYDYGRGRGRITSDDGPSPYVGLIDVENSLMPPRETNKAKRRRHHVPSTSEYDGNDYIGLVPSEQNQVQPLSERDRRKRERRQKRSNSPTAPPGGSYRIPQQGQLQIIIKNPNKTAVKLFLVPYDLQGMEAGTKTFIRQRSYSTGPIIEAPIQAKSAFYPEDPHSMLLDAARHSQDRPTLRYLIHLHICCPSKGRFYLYKSIRVVFANRVPDGKENLKNEIQLPEPRYTSYKPGRDSIVVPSPSTKASGAAERAFRRRSSGFALGPYSYDTVDGIAQSMASSSTILSSHPYGVVSAASPVLSFPFALERPTIAAPAEASEDSMDLDSPQRSKPTTSILGVSPSFHSDGLARPPLPRSSSSPHGSSLGQNAFYDKYVQAEGGFGGNASSTGSAISEGLLARKLKGLDVEREFP